MKSWKSDIESAMGISSIDEVTSLSFSLDGITTAYMPIANWIDNVLTRAICEENKCQVQTLAVSSLFSSGSTTMRCFGSVNFRFESRKLDETLFGARLFQSSEEKGFEVVIEKLIGI